MIIFRCVCCNTNILCLMRRAKRKAEVKESTAKKAKNEPKAVCRGHHVEFKLQCTPEALWLHTTRVL